MNDLNVLSIQDYEIDQDDLCDKEPDIYYPTSVVRLVTDVAKIEYLANEIKRYFVGKYPGLTEEDFVLKYVYDDNCAVGISLSKKVVIVGTATLTIGVSVLLQS